jgi:hypothetical protein
MGQVAGIILERAGDGEPKSITFDYKIYGELLRNFFVKEGLDNPYSPYNKKEVDMLLRTKSDMQLGSRNKVDMANFWDE